MHTGRLRLHFVGEMTGFSGQSPEGMGSQAEPGNQEAYSLKKCLTLFALFRHVLPIAKAAIERTCLWK